MCYEIVHGGDHLVNVSSLRTTGTVLVRGSDIAYNAALLPMIQYAFKYR
jgi:hypothetical protein